MTSERSLVLDLSLAGCFAALYAVGVIALAPVSYSVFQVRLADALIPLSIVYGLPVVYGVTLGNIVANLYGGYGPVDVVFGTLANLLASYLAFRLRAKPFFACFSAALVLSLIVGGYLWLLLNVPPEVSLFGLFAGSSISVTALGYLLQRLLSPKSRRNLPER